jgi:virulence factor Mce-like protein
MTTVVASTSCSMQPSDLPSAKSGIGSGYTVMLEFASALNLPDQADVMMDGLRIGEVGPITVTGQAVEVAVRIEEGTQLPADLRAVIRQNTLLGDTYIALEKNPDHSTAGILGEGDTVPLSQTTSPPQLEDTMAVLATFINGGSVQKVEDAITRINDVMPRVPEVEKLASTVAVDLRDLSQNTGELDRTLEGLDSTAVSINDKSAEISEMLTPTAMHYWQRINVDVLSYVGTLLPSIGSIFEGGMWLVPMLNSLASTAAVIRTTGEDVPADAEILSAFLRETILPFLRNPSVNVVSVSSPQGEELLGDVENVLRMLGAVK